MRSLRAAAALLLLSGALAAPLASAAGPATSPYLEELTWTELRALQQAGTTTVLVPIGGTEQSGPAIALGKHNARARWLAGRIAAKLGNAVVAPVLAYVPEGAISPPAAHMRFTGTISISDAAFEAVLESTARSFRQHGFRDVVFLGDHGDYQKSEERVAKKLAREWPAPGETRVHALLDYYRVTQAGYVELLKARGFSAAEIGTHAGLADTALTMAVDAALVRPEAFERAAKEGVAVGVHGDPRKATADIGRAGLELVVETSVARIRELTSAR
ncbi:MAG TPA: creatininase family protein [Burkholderiaceae bacterium]|nr:creatininase family protein [Burkholderiaceae bacterium]